MMFGSATDSRFELPTQPAYDHTQRAPLYLLMLAPALVILWAAFALANSNEEAIALAVGSAAIGLLTYSMQHLRVYDGGDALRLRFGPIPLFGKRIPYEKIEDAAEDRTTFWDGWGIHWVPFRGWTYNLWGYDCVRLALAGNRTVRIGTDDPAGLAEFLREKCRLPAEARC